MERFNHRLLIRLTTKPTLNKCVGKATPIPRPANVIMPTITAQFQQFNCTALCEKQCRTSSTRTEAAQLARIAWSHFELLRLLLQPVHRPLRRHLSQVEHTEAQGHTRPKITAKHKWFRKLKAGQIARSTAGATSSQRFARTSKDFPHRGASESPELQMSTPTVLTVSI